MDIRYSTVFTEGFKKLSPHEQKLTIRTIELFESDPNHPSLNNHPLHPPMALDRSISVNDDIRIIFRKKKDYISVVLLDVGDHNRVYGN